VNVAHRVAGSDGPRQCCPVVRYVPATITRVTEQTDGSELDLIMRLERELQTKACRNDRARLLELLAPDFVEVGASGRVWDRSRILQLLASQAGDTDEITVTNLAGRMLAERFALVHWGSVYKGQSARRTSLWRHDEHGWRLVHHQATVLPD